MRFVWAGAILLTAGCWTALAEPVGIKPETCLSVKTAALRLGELAETIIPEPGTGTATTHLESKEAAR